MPEITLKSRSKSIKSEQLRVTSLQDLVSQISKSNKLNSNRIRLTDPETKKIITDDSLKSIEIVNAKDLGPQISWRGVYIIEYFGPILIHYVVYNYLANKPAEYNLIYKLNLIHYLKREFETLFVHRFSSSTMPFFNLFKNSGHYWALGGSLALMYLDIGNFEIPQLNPLKEYALYFWVFSEFFNFITHTQLRLLGDKSLAIGKPREAPKGGFFEIFIAPNYTFEIYSWLSVFLLNPNVFTLVFWLVGTVQMYFWAIKKAQKYQNKRKRYFLIPFVL